MSLQAEFVQAQIEVKTLAQRPDNDTLLKLYALFKQGSQGDVTGSRPGMLDFVGRAKWDAWSQLKGESTEAAQQRYVELVRSLSA